MWVGEKANTGVLKEGRTENQRPGTSLEGKAFDVVTKAPTSEWV